MRTAGEITPLHILKEIRKMWLKGLSAPSLEEFFQKKYPNQKGLSKNNLDSIVQRLKTESIRNVPKFSKTEITNRPAIVGKNQEGLSKAQEILNNPKKRQAFKKFANTSGVTLDQVRKKFGVSSIHESGLRTLIKKPIEAGAVTHETVAKRKKALNYLKTLSPGSDVNANRIANKTSHSLINVKHALEQPEIKAKKFNMIPFEGKNFLSSEKFKELFEKFQKEQPPTVLKTTPEASNAAFAKTLNDAGYTARGDKPWNARNVGSRRSKLDLVTSISPTPMDVTTDAKKYNINTKGLSQAAIIQKIRNARKQEQLKIRRQNPAFREYERKRSQKYQASLSKEEKQRRLEKIRTSGKARMWGLVPVDYYHPQAKGFLWRDLIENALRRQHGKLENSHIKFLRKTDRSSLTSIPKTEKVKLVDLKVIDPKTGKPKIITYDNVFDHIDENKSLYGTDSERVISEYQKKRITQNNPDLRDRLNRIVFKDRYDPTDWKSRRFMAPGVIHHTRGRANNAFNVQFAINPENKRESELRRIFETDFRDAGKSLRGKVDAMKNYLGSVEEEIPNIEVGFKKKSYGERELFPQTMKRTGGAPIAQLVKDLYKQPEFKLEFENVMNEVAGRKICRDGCFIKVGKQNPGLLQRTLQKLAGKGGRLGAILAGAGAVGAGTYAMMGGAEADETMKYNATTGEFDNAEGEPETQEGILNWIADNPIKSGLAPIPALLGVSHFAPKAAARALTSFPALVAPALAAEKLYQYKQGVDPGDMALDPLNAIWALGWDSPKTGMGPAGAKGAYYAGLSDSQKLGLRKLATKQGWKDLPKAMKAGIMSPRAAGTKMVFPFAGPKAGAGIGSTLLRGGARLLPFGPIPLALSAGYYGWNKYKDVRDTNSILDSMRERGNISEEDADTLRTIMKQGWLGTTSLGAKILGSEELELGGQMVGLDQQKQILDNLLKDVDEFQSSRQDVTAKDRQQEFFSWFSDGGRVGMKTGGMDRRTFLKWIAGLAATATGLIKGKGLTTKAPIAKAVPKAIAKFQGVEGMPLWFPRAVAKIKAHGKLLSMADKDYVQGDMYEMMIPIQKYYSKGARGEGTQIKTEMEKVIMEENPLTGEISMQWTGTDNFGDDAVRQINFTPGSAGYQKFGVDPEYPQAWEYQRVKVDEPEFTYSQPDQSQPYRDDIEYLDIATEGDEIVAGLEKMSGGKNMVTKDGSVIDMTDYTPKDKEIDEAFKKKLYRDVDQEEALIPDPEGQLGPDGDWLGDAPNEMIEGEVPAWVPKDEWPKKASGGIIETGEIARRPGAVAPLSGPSPQGILSLYSNPKQVNVG